MANPHTRARQVEELQGANFYTMLDVAPDAGASDIRRAFRQRSLVVRKHMMVVTTTTRRSCCLRWFYYCSRARESGDCWHQGHSACGVVKWGTSGTCVCIENPSFPPRVHDQ